MFKLKHVVEMLQLIKSYFTYFMVCMIMIEFDYSLICAHSPENLNMMHTREGAIRSLQGLDLGHKTVGIQG